MGPSNRFSLSFPLSFSSSSYFLFFSQNKNQYFLFATGKWLLPSPSVWWAGAWEPRCTSSLTGLPTVGDLSPSPMGNLDSVNHRGNAGEGCINGHTLWSMARWFLRLTRLTLVCEVNSYRLVHDQVRQKLKKKKKDRVGGPKLPFSISSSFILFFVLLPFLLKTKKISLSAPTLLRCMLSVLE